MLKVVLTNCINKPLVLARVPPTASAPPTSLTKPTQPLITIITQQCHPVHCITPAAPWIPIVNVAPLCQFVAYNTLEYGISVIDLYTTLHHSNSQLLLL